MFFNTLQRTFSHVGIYIGDGKFIHSPRAGGQVRVEDMRIAYWTQRFATHGFEPYDIVRPRVWGDPAVAGAARLAAVLSKQKDGKSWWKELELTSILVPRRVGLQCRGARRPRRLTARRWCRRDRDVAKEC